jgi:hypothetical protein
MVKSFDVQYDSEICREELEQVMKSLSQDRQCAENNYSREPLEK